MRLHLEQPIKPLLCAQPRRECTAGSLSKKDPLIDGIPLPSREILDNIERHRKQRNQRPQLPLYDSDANQGQGNDYGTPQPVVVERGIHRESFI